MAKIRQESTLIGFKGDIIILVRKYLSFGQLIKNLNAYDFKNVELFPHYGSNKL
jgi:hypothetical protein